MSARFEGFFVAPYAPDGEFLGIGFRKLMELSPRWLDAAGQFLHANGTSFRASWGRELWDIETQLTSSSVGGLCTFYAGGRIVSSHLFLIGGNLEAEQELTEMFLKSLLGVRLVQLLAEGREPFASARALMQRPLEVVVIWPVDAVAEARVEMTHELSRHFAGAFFEAQLQGA